MSTNSIFFELVEMAKSCCKQINQIKDCLDRYYEGYDDSYDLLSLVQDIEKIVG